MPEKPRERRPERDELPPLPELDDDGATHDADDDGHLVVTDESVGLDDAALGDDARFSETLIGGDGGDRGEHGLLDDAEGHDGLEVGVEISGLGEHGLLEGSDEGDGRDVTEGEAGVLEEHDHTVDDGGSEGTDEDPADAIDEDKHLPPLHVDAAIAEDEEGVDDVGALEDRGQARLRAELERTPWPPRSDVAWEVAKAVLPPRPLSMPPPPRPTVPTPFALREDDRWAATGELVVVARFGTPLMLSTDGGKRFVALANCSSATAIAIVPLVSLVPARTFGPHVVVALHDVVRDVAALAVVRIEEGRAPVAEVVAELPRAHREEAAGLDEEESDRARVDTLSVTTTASRVEVLATGMGFAFRLVG